MDTASSNTTQLLDYLLQGFFVFFGAWLGALFAYLFDRRREREGKIGLSKAQLKGYLEVYENPEGAATTERYVAHLYAIRDSVNLIHARLNAQPSLALTAQNVDRDTWQNFFKLFQMYLYPEKLRNIIDSNADVLPDELAKRLETLWRSTTLLQMALTGYKEFVDRYIEPIFLTKQKLEFSDQLLVNDYSLHLNRVIGLYEGYQKARDSALPEISSYMEQSSS